MEIRKINILLIEDNPDDVILLQGTLEKVGGGRFELETAVKMADALAWLARGQTDLVLLDLNLPDSSGLDTFKTVHAAARGVPVIILSGVDDETTAVNAVHAGAEDYLVKDRLTPPLVLRAIIYAMERAEAKKAAQTAQEKYRSIFENSVSGIFQTSPEGRYLNVNPALARIYGYGSTEELMSRISDIARLLYVDPNRRAEFIKLMQEQGVVKDFESQIYRKDESVIWIAENARAVRNAEGKIEYYEGMVEDITLRKEAEERERRAKAELARSQAELQKKNDIMEADLKTARDIQLAMLPQQYPTFPLGVQPEQSLLQFRHRYQPTGQVGGDFFNVLPLAANKAGLFICDVMGHGVRSALVTAMLRALVEELRPVAEEPGQLLTRINRDLRSILQQTGTPLFTTAFYLVADLEKRQITYANAGHPRPFLVHRGRGEVEILKYNDGKARPALGLFENTAYPMASRPLAGGDLVLLFTDGLYEVEGPGNAAFSQDQLMEAVRGHARLHCEELLNALLKEIREFAQGQEFNDDVCLVGMEASEKL
jgi:sigma-B regulation protein RsbU (phosphoserine phosphatase)